MVDEDGDLFPTSLYAETKVNLEKYLIKNISNSTVLRCATAYGLSVGRMRFDLLVSDFIKEAWLEKTNQCLYARSTQTYCSCK